VKPEPDYCLYVRFQEGLNGRVRLQPEELTGVLEPLRDERFFRKVRITLGAVSWPGDIDLAPDAMYSQVASQHNSQAPTLTNSRSSAGTATAVRLDYKHAALVFHAAEQFPEGGGPRVLKEAPCAIVGTCG
jgi:hypothetical protein